jgi:hypothetical protein
MELSMNIISHSSIINLLPGSPLKIHTQTRFDQLSEDIEVPPTITILTPDTNLESPEMHF